MLPKLPCTHHSFVTRDCTGITQPTAYSFRKGVQGYTRTSSTALLSEISLCGAVCCGHDGQIERCCDWHQPSLQIRFGLYAAEDGSEDGRAVPRLICLSTDAAGSVHCLPAPWQHLQHGPPSNIPCYLQPRPPYDEALEACASMESRVPTTKLKTSLNSS